MQARGILGETNIFCIMRIDRYALSGSGGMCRQTLLWVLAAYLTLPWTQASDLIAQESDDTGANHWAGVFDGSPSPARRARLCLKIRTSTGLF